MFIEVGGSYIPTWPGGVVIIVVLMIILWRRKHGFVYLTCFTLFGIYLLFALDKALFPIVISGPYADAMREGRRLSSFINLIPLNFNFSELPNLVLLQIFQNILLTIPFGFGVSFIAPVRPKDFRWIIPAVGFGIEGMQLLSSLILGYPHRVLDINDAILNTAGVAIGYGLFRVLAWLYLLVAQRFSIGHSGLTAFFSAASGQMDPGY